MDNRTHALILDHDKERVYTIAKHLNNDDMEVHMSFRRANAVSTLLKLQMRRIMPRIIVCNWLADSPSSREFYQLIGREIDQTALNVFKVASLNDEMTDGQKTFMICYARDYDQASTELAAAGLHNVALIKYRSEQDILRVARMVINDERTRAYRIAAAMSPEYMPTHQAYDPDAPTIKKVSTSVKLLSR